MADHAVSVAAHAHWDTSSHVTAGKPLYAPTTPTKLRWSDVHPSIGAAYKLAMERLERLCFVAWGSRPLSYSPFKDWYHRLNTRCLWQAEQWAQHKCDDNEACLRWYWEFYETGALGTSWNGKMPVPRMPIRSRSGDPMLQYLDDTMRTHDRTYFPAGSVTRSNGDARPQSDYQGRPTFDPCGDGDFGGDPAQIGTDGPIHIDADAVTVTHVVPSALPGTVTSATLHYRVGASETTLTMQQAPAKTWKATIPGMTHNTLVHWWLEITYQPLSGPSVTRSEPATGDPYSFRFFSHWNPFPNGLPELWSKCKKGTDSYAFAGDETIQFEQVTQARWVLDRLGEQFYHSPHVRSQMPNCCREQHVVFRWSGSNRWPHYLDGGKAGTTPGSWPIEPLHNLSPDSPVGSLLARQSWRGVDLLWPENPKYGEGVSWGSPPGRLLLSPPKYSGDIGCKIYNALGGRGLQVGDVISETHLLEIIAAVDYFVRYGLWVKTPIRRRAMTPNWNIHWDRPCGWVIYSNSETNYDGYEWNGYGHDGWPNGHYLACMYWDNAAQEWKSWEAPADWDACWNTATSSPPTGPLGVCTVFTERFESCFAWEPEGSGSISDHRIHCTDPTFPAPGFDPGLDLHRYFVHQGGYAHQINEMVTMWDNKPPHDPYPAYSSEVKGENSGWAAYICGPLRNPGGPDAQHGNGLFKQRETQSCPYPDLRHEFVSSGNCLGEAYFCGTLYNGNGTPRTDPHNLAFETVTAAYYPGATTSWVDWAGEPQCDAEGAECPYWEGRLPAVPGFPEWRYPDNDDGSPGAFLCGKTCRQPDQYGEYRNDFSCRLTYNTGCQDDYGSWESWVWAAIDLALSKAGGGTVPYGAHADHNPDDSSMLPTLHDYDPDPIEGREATECPCQTWTGPTSCE